MAPAGREALQAVRAELGAAGPRHDAQQPKRAYRLLNITPDTGELLAVLVRASAARTILEIGTSNGYSTLWLAVFRRPARERSASAHCGPGARRG